MVIVFYGYISIVLWQQNFIPRNFNLILLFNESSITIVSVNRNILNTLWHNCHPTVLGLPSRLVQMTVGGVGELTIHYSIV